MSAEDQVASHYSLGRIAETILEAVRQVADDPQNLKPDDLAPVDEFHVGGREATDHFVSQLELQPDTRVLDIGCGIGGPARYVAAHHGCRVDGVDLTPEYCDVATLLSEKVGLADRVSFQQASALDLPFDDETFHAAYMIHVGMNIADKENCYKEAYRVLQPGGVFGIYDILTGESDGTLEFPVPWATTADTSFLAKIDEVRTHARGAGFTLEHETHRDEFAVELFARLKQQSGDEAPPVGIHLLMGDDFPLKAKNMINNVGQGWCSPWEIICRKA